MSEAATSLSAYEILDGLGAKLVSEKEQLSGFAPEDIFELCAVPRNSEVEVKLVTDWEGKLEDPAELVPAGLHITVRAAGVINTTNEFVIYKRGDVEDAELWLYLKLIDFGSGAPKGVGKELVRRIASAARRLDFVGLRLQAAGGRNWEPRNVDTGERWGGYYVWAKCGFDGSLTEEDETGRGFRDIVKYFPHVPGKLSKCTTVLQVAELDNGLDWWKLCGDGSYMTFMVQELNGPSWRRLDPSLEDEFMNTLEQTDELLLSQPAQFSRECAPRCGLDAILTNLPRVNSPTLEEVDHSLGAARTSKRGTRAEISEALF